MVECSSERHQQKKFCAVALTLKKRKYVWWMCWCILLLFVGMLLLGLFSRKYIRTNVRIKLCMLFAAILLASYCVSIFMDYIEVEHPIQLGCDAKQTLKTYILWMFMSALQQAFLWKELTKKWELVKEQISQGEQWLVILKIQTIHSSTYYWATLHQILKQTFSWIFPFMFNVYVNERCYDPTKHRGKI